MRGPVRVWKRRPAVAQGVPQRFRRWMGGRKSTGQHGLPRRNIGAVRWAGQALDELSTNRKGHTGAPEICFFFPRGPVAGRV